MHVKSIIAILLMLATCSIVAAQTSPQIYQGDVVYVNDTYDVSLVVPPYPQLAYWDGRDMYDEPPTYNYTMSDYKRDYYNFYIDPSIFTNRPGRWYKYDYKFEKNSNNLAFIVVPMEFKNTTLTLHNGSVINVSEVAEHENVEHQKIKEEILPVKAESGYLLTTEEMFNISSPTLAAGWIFNKDNNDILYEVSTKHDKVSDIVFSDKQIQSLSAGDYKILIQTPANDAENFDVIYDPSTKNIKWFDRSTFDVHKISSDLMTPDVAIAKLEEIFPRTHDKYTITKLVIQDPEITVASMHEVFAGAAKEYYSDETMRGNVSVMDVRGYTNVRPGVNITVTLDEDKHFGKELARYTYHTQAQGGYGNEWRYYQIYVPLYWDSLNPGIHTLRASTDISGFVYADFPVNEMPADSFVPQPTVRWVGDENPWKANMTTQVVTVVQTQIVEREVIVEVTPSNEAVYSAQKQVEQERFNYWMDIAKWVFGGIALFAIVGYAAVVVYRGKRQ